ncbi:MAG: pyridoxamine 5'-phosphate oxidase family protein [Terracidiphilus sp.]|jgi:uncharacterized protein YhbP (UPF0306 family)
MEATRKQIKLVAKLLREETTLSLASIGADGAPSAAPLFYIVDEDLSLYWLSSEGSQHSRNLLGRADAAATIHCNAKSWQEIRGVQMRGEVSKVTDPQRRTRIVKAYGERFKLGRVFRLAIRGSALYVLQPNFFRYIDNSNGFGGNFELARPAEGWALSRPTA